MAYGLGPDFDELVAQRDQGPIFNLAGRPQCPLMAKPRHSRHVRGTSGIAPASDIPSTMSASPLTPDVGDAPRERLLMTLTGHRAR